MTLSAATRRVQFTVGSSGQAGPYAFSFKVLNQDDLAVYVGSTTASTLKTISTHYTVSLAAAGTGTITFVSGQEPTTAQLVTIIGDRAIARTTDFTAGGDIRASTLNDDGDAQTILIQQLEEKVDRSIQIQTFGARNFASGGDGPLFWPYDTTSNNASKLVAFTSGGNALELVDKNTSALGGSDTQVQFNSSGTALGGSANLTFDGTNLSSAGIDLNGNLDVATQATDILMIDNNAAALEIKEGSNAYLTMVTTNSGEKITLGKKLEAGSVEIEGSAFDIDGGDISAATISGSLTWSAAQNLNSQALTNVDINSGSVDGATIGAASPSTIVGTTITANTSLLPDAAGGADIGSTSAEWGDIYVADDKAIKLGSDQDLTIEYDEDGLATTRVVGAGGLTMSPHGTSSGNTTELRFLELAANGNNYAGFKAPNSITGTSVYTLPAAYPASNKILQSTDAGVLTWETAATSGATLANDGNNRVTTATGSGGVTGEAKLLFDPPNLTIGNATAEDVALVYDGNAKDFYIGLDDSEDKLVVGVGSTVGTNNILTLTDDAVTVGDGAAVDTKIVLDGNAQDFYMGLDDTDDSFKIGLGTAVGTTAHIVSSASGEVNMPLQPLFLVRSPGAANATGGGTQYIVVASNEIYDIGSNWSSATFTAPITGKYLLGGSIYISGLTSSMDSCSFGVVTSNYTAGYWFYFGNIGAMRDNNNAVLINGSILADMDASDTAQFKIQINSGSDVADIGASDTNLFGALVA